MTRKSEDNGAGKDTWRWREPW